MWDIAGITPKKKKNIGETATQVTDTSIVAPIEPLKTDAIQPFNDATKGQDVQFRQSYRQALETPKITETPTATSPTGLSWAELQAYNMLTPQEQKTFQALATQWLKAQTDYLAKSKASMEFAKSQEAKRTEMEDNQDAIADMNSQRNIEEATKQVANLKQNIGYLWTGGQPWVSSQKLDAVSNQVTLADRTLKNILESERLSARNRELGQEKNSEIFTRQIKILQDDLDSKVNKTVQSALNEFTSAELAGKLDTIPEIEAFQQQLYAQLDWDLSSIMDTNIEARQFLIERYDKLAESQKAAMANKEKAEAEALKRKNTLNKEMSQALGYYVNENGEAITDRVTGQNIVVPPESDVTYDKDSGQMVILTKNRDGSVGVQIKQVAAWKSPAPQTTVIENPDGSKSTLQWNGTWWVPLQWVQSSGWAVTPTWNIVPVTAWGKTVRLDQAGANNFSNAVNQLVSLNMPIVFKNGDAGARDQVATIKSMADRFGIPFNANNPAETAAAIRAKWAPVADPWKSNHESGMAIDVYGSSKLDAVTPEQERVLNANGWFSAWIPWDAGHFEYRGTPSAQWWLEDNIQVKVANIGNIAFGKTMSDAEGKRVESIIKQYPNASVNDIALAVRWLNIKNEADKETALQYVNVLDKVSDNVKPKGYEMTISKYINAGDYAWLNDFVNKHIENDIKATTPSDVFIPTSTINSGTKNINEIISLIEKNKDKIGIVEGNFTKLGKKFAGDADIQKLQTLMTGTFANLRKNFAGSAVTSTELDALKDYIAGDITEVPENLITKLETLRDMQKYEYDQQRSMYDLPNTKAISAKKKLGWASLMDIISILKPNP